MAVNVSCDFIRIDGKLAVSVLMSSLGLNTSSYGYIKYIDFCTSGMSQRDGNKINGPIRQGFHMLKSII